MTDFELAVYDLETGHMSIKTVTADSAIEAISKVRSDNPGKRLEVRNVTPVRTNY